jgi:hypothetical protein
MTKIKSLKQIDELNSIIAQQTKKISLQLKNEFAIAQNAKVKDILDKISKDYNIPINELYNKYLTSTTKNVKQNIINDSEESESPIEETPPKMIYTILEINGKEYFMNDGVLYNNKKKVIGKMENEKPIFY